MEFQLVILVRLASRKAGFLLFVDETVSESLVNFRTLLCTQ